MSGWRLSWGDESFGADDLTVGDTSTAHILGGGGWGADDPTLSPHHAACLLAAVLARRTGRQPLDVVAEIHARPHSELVGAFSAS